MNISKIDLSPKALKERREVAEKAIFEPWKRDTEICYNPAEHIAFNNPTAVIAMIDEIERLRETVKWQAKQLLACGFITDELAR